jgi:hypothetical protein
MLQWNRLKINYWKYPTWYAPAVVQLRSPFSWAVVSCD